MKNLKLLFFTIITSIVLTSCTTQNNNDNFTSLEGLISSYDLWYIDYNRTEGTGDIPPFLSTAFTLSFFNGTLYANNNIVDSGRTGEGLGIIVGNYHTDRGFLEINHDIDGFVDFDVVRLSNNEIRIDDLTQNLSYFLIGSQRDDFNYDQLFYDNIEFFLQEYTAWERILIEQGEENIFDEERFLQFELGNAAIFNSSTDLSNTDVNNLFIDFTGNYQVLDVIGNDKLKGLILNYDRGDTETFELKVIDDGTIELFHQTSQTFYTFTGREFLELRKASASAKSTSKPINNNRKRTIIKRQAIERQNLK